MAALNNTHLHKNPSKYDFKTNMWKRISIQISWYNREHWKRALPWLTEAQKGKFQKLVYMTKLLEIIKSVWRDNLNREKPLQTLKGIFSHFDEVLGSEGNKKGGKPSPPTWCRKTIFRCIPEQEFFSRK